MQPTWQGVSLSELSFPDSLASQVIHCFSSLDYISFVRRQCFDFCKFIAYLKTDLPFFQIRPCLVSGGGDVGQFSVGGALIFLS